MKCGVRSVECEDFASSLAEKKSRLSREGHGRDRLASNYRSFMFGKLPPPACPGLCYDTGVSEIVGSPSHHGVQHCNRLIWMIIWGDLPLTGNLHRL